jgi:hypothetical protein
MSQRTLEEFGAYRKARKLFDLTATIERLRAQPSPATTGSVREEAPDYGQ